MNPREKAFLKYINANLLFRVGLVESWHVTKVKSAFVTALYGVDLGNHSLRNLTVTYSNTINSAEFLIFSIPVHDLLVKDVRWEVTDQPGNGRGLL